MLANLATPWLIVSRKRPSFVIIKQITMTNTFNIAGADGNVMVPVLSETGSLMAYLLYPDPTGILQGSMGVRPSPGNTQAISRQYPCTLMTMQAGTFKQEGSLFYTNAFGCTGQPIIRSLLKSKT